MKMRTDNVFIIGCEAKYNQKGEPYLLVRVDDGTGKVEVLVDKDMNRQLYYQRGVIGTMFFNVTLGRYTNVRIIDFKQTNGSSVQIQQSQPQPQQYPQQNYNYNRQQQMKQYNVSPQRPYNYNYNSNGYYNVPPQPQQSYNNNYYNTSQQPQQPCYNYYNAPPQQSYNNYNVSSQQYEEPILPPQEQEQERVEVEITENNDIKESEE